MANWPYENTREVYYMQTLNAEVIGTVVICTQWRARCSVCTVRSL